jgi:PPM family protein phosphatase
MNTSSSEPAPDTRWLLSQAQDQGRRKRQEDAYGHAQQGEWQLLVLADGVGGLPDGDRAARAAVEGSLHAFANAPEPTDWAEDDDFRSWVEQWLHPEVLARYQLDNLHPMACTTLIIACVHRASGICQAAYAGDSILLHSNREGGLLFQHARHQNRIGEITRVITRGWSDPTEPVFDYWRSEIQPGESLLLASDGLDALLKQPRSLEPLLRSPDPHGAQRLVDAVLTHHNPFQDNVTVQLLWRLHA